MEAPAAVAGESLREYYARSADFWTSLADSVLREEEKDEGATEEGLRGSKTLSKLTEKQKAKRLKEVRKRPSPYARRPSCGAMREFYLIMLTV